MIRNAPSQAEHDLLHYAYACLTFAKQVDVFLTPSGDDGEPAILRRRVENAACGVELSEVKSENLQFRCRRVWRVV